MKHALIKVFATGLLAAASVANADTLNEYTISGAVFSNGDTLTGSWIFDSTINSILSVNLVDSGFSGPLTVSPAQYTTQVPGSSSGNNTTWEFVAQTAAANQSVFVDFDTVTGSLGATLGNLTYYTSEHFSALPSFADSVLTNAGTSTVAAVPEPGTYAMIAVGLLVIGGATRRRVAG